MPQMSVFAKDDAISILMKYIDYFKTREFPEYSAAVWKNLAKENKGIWSQHCWWVNVTKDRRGILSTARENMGIIITESTKENNQNESQCEEGAMQYSRFYEATQLSEETEDEFEKADRVSLVKDEIPADPLKMSQDHYRKLYRMNKRATSQLIALIDKQSPDTFRNTKTYMTREQRSLLISMLNADKDLKTGRFTKDFTKDKARERWQIIASELHKLPGAVKHWKQWRKTYQDLKNQLKTKKAVILKQKRQRAKSRLVMGEDEEAILDAHCKYNSQNQDEFMENRDCIDSNNMNHMETEYLDEYLEEIKEIYNRNTEDEKAEASHASDFEPIEEETIPVIKQQISPESSLITQTAIQEKSNDSNPVHEDAFSEHVPEFASNCTGSVPEEESPDSKRNVFGNQRIRQQQQQQQQPVVNNTHHRVYNSKLEHKLDVSSRLADAAKEDALYRHKYSQEKLKIAGAKLELYKQEVVERRHRNLLKERQLDLYQEQIDAMREQNSLLKEIRDALLLSRRSNGKE